jgi:beta-lactamase class A
MSVERLIRELRRTLDDAGLRGITVRHTIRELNETLAERLDPADVHFAHFLAIEAGTAGRGHRVPQLDVTRADTSRSTTADVIPLPGPRQR